jgi:hypothetical protein
MNIILLAGPEKKGKTPTLDMVYAQLAQNMQNPPQKQQIKGVLTDDFESSPLLHNGKTVAIFSLGDTKYQVDDAIKKYGGIVDVLIIACRTGFKWSNALIANFQGSPNNCVIQKTVVNTSNLETQANTQDCQTIISKI